MCDSNKSGTHDVALVSRFAYNKGIRGGGYHRRRKSSTLPLPYFFYKISIKKDPLRGRWICVRLLPLSLRSFLQCLLRPSLLHLGLRMIRSSLAFHKESLRSFCTLWRCCRNIHHCESKEQRSKLSNLTIHYIFL